MSVFVHSTKIDPNNTTAQPLQAAKHWLLSIPESISVFESLV